MTQLQADILSAVGSAFPTDPPAKLGVAVSGGGDSVALLHALAQLWDRETVELHAATVDHGLRPQARQEAEWVVRTCENLGITHSTLRWKGWDGQGNLQDAARRARYGLLTDWAQSWQIPEVALGHTADDQAETVLMRLSRGAGVTGLSAMPLRRRRDGISFVRPMLGLLREDLRDFLRMQDATWLEDPSNEDPAYERVRARQALDALAPMGLTVRSLSQVAENMGQAAAALNWYAFLAARDVIQVDGGDVLIARSPFRTLPDEIARRLIMEAVRWIGGTTYPPRRTPLAQLIRAARGGDDGTLGGCRMVQHGDHIWICREFNAVRGERCVPPGVWDRRWRLSGPEMEGCVIRPLGRAGLSHCAGWRETGRPHAALVASPAVWRGSDLVAAPMAGEPAGWRADVCGGSEDFFASLLAH